MIEMTDGMKCSGLDVINRFTTGEILPLFLRLFLALGEYVHDFRFRFLKVVTVSLMGFLPRVLTLPVIYLSST